MPCLLQFIHSFTHSGIWKAHIFFTTLLCCFLRRLSVKRRAASRLRWTTRNLPKIRRRHWRPSRRCQSPRGRKALAVVLRLHASPQGFSHVYSGTCMYCISSMLVNIKSNRLDIFCYQHWSFWGFKCMIYPHFVQQDTLAKVFFWLWLFSIFVIAVV